MRTKKSSGESGTIEKMSFEEALHELEEMVRSLETGEVPLEESIKKYERGIKVYRYCLEKLESYERKIELLSKDGSISEFSPEEQEGEEE